MEGSGRYRRLRGRARREDSDREGLMSGLYILKVVLLVGCGSGGGLYKGGDNRLINTRRDIPLIKGIYIQLGSPLVKLLI